jgi:hypothetical protein
VTTDKLFYLPALNPELSRRVEGLNENNKKLLYQHGFKYAIWDFKKKQTAGSIRESGFDRGN